MARKGEKDEEPQVYVARSSGTIRIDGRRYTYFRNQTHVPVGHPLLRVLPDRFAPMKSDTTKPSPEIPVRAAVREIASPSMVVEVPGPETFTPESDGIVLPRSEG